MKVHTTPKIHELVSTAGKNPSVTPSTSSLQTATFNLNTLPTGKAGKFWYYAASAVTKVVTTFDQAAMGGSVVNPDKLWKVMASFQVSCPILGELYPHRNTTGAVLGNIIQVLANGYNQFPLNAQIAAADGDTTVTLFYRIPFAMEFLKKPHETAIWTGMLEGGQLECKLALSNVCDGDSTGAVLKAPTNFRCWLELIPSPEAVIHTPAHFRIYETPGSTTRHQLLDMGAPDGLKGIDIGKGAGLPFLAYLTDATGIGLGGADGVDNITGLDINWRDQDRIDAPEAFMAALYMMKRRNVYGNGGGAVGTTIPHDNGWPLALSGTNGPTLMGAQNYLFPVIAPGFESETSKFQSVKGARDINFAYTSTPSASAKWLSVEMPVFEAGFSEGLKDLLLGGSHPDAVLEPKTLNKQVGGVHGVGKLAYVRQKVTLRK